MQYDEFRKLGAEVLVIGSSQPEALHVYETAKRWPFVLVTDPTLESYRAAGLERARWRTFLKPRVMWGYLKQMLRGWLPERPYENQDLLQLGGDFVLDHQRRVAYAHPCSDPVDRPSPEALLQAVRSIGVTK